MGWNNLAGEGCTFTFTLPVARLMLLSIGAASFARKAGLVDRRKNQHSRGNYLDIPSG